ncbi:MAG: class I SAM-dependent methyltransferase [Elusimicrobia bacterium]|nr:class I SAM-dependent methyltransferase [Elusimicrobiota bacterium]
MDAEHRLRTGLGCQTRHKGGGLFLVTIDGRGRLIFMVPVEDSGSGPSYFSTAHFRVCLRGEQSPMGEEEQKRLKGYLLLLREYDDRLNAAWPRTTPWAAASASPSLAEVRLILEGYRPYFAGSEVPPARRKGVRGNLGHYALLLHYLLTRHPALRPGADSPRLLEIGCHYGLFMDLLTKRGYKHAAGIDIDEGCTEFAAGRGLDARCVNAVDLAAHFPPDFFDVAFGIEFFPMDLKPFGRDDIRAWILDVFKSVLGRLKPGGAFFCGAEVPLPVKSILALGFKTKHSVRRPKFLSGVRISARDDVWVFEKRARAGARAEKNSIIPP